MSLSGDDVRRLTRHVIDVERPLKAAQAALEEAGAIGFGVALGDAQDALEDAQRALNDLLDNVPRGIG